jgi:hypothetical protein
LDFKTKELEFEDAVKPFLNSQHHGRSLSPFFALLKLLGYHVSLEWEHWTVAEFYARVKLPIRWVLYDSVVSLPKS